MSERYRKMQRVLKVQEQLHRAAELNLINLHRQALELQNEQDALVAAMNDHEMLHGLFVNVAAKRLQTLAGQAAQVDVARESQKEITFERAMQVKRCEKTTSVLKDESRRHEEDKHLRAIIEQLPSKARASFP